MQKSEQQMQFEAALGLVRESKNRFAGVIKSATYQEKTNSISILVAVKNMNGQPKATKDVTFSVPTKHPIAIGAAAGTVTHIGFSALGFSDKPIKEGKNGFAPIFAVKALSKDSLESILSDSYSTLDDIEDSTELKKQEAMPMATAAREWLKSKVIKAKKG